MLKALGMPTRLHHRQVARQVGPFIGEGVFKAVANARLRGQMDHDFRLCVLERSVERISILDHEFMRGEGVCLAQQGMARALEGDIVIGRHAIYADDYMAVRQQPARQMEADETRRAGDQKTHGKADCMFARQVTSVVTSQAPA